MHLVKDLREPRNLSTGPALRENRFCRAYIAVLREASMTRIAPEAGLLASAFALLAAVIALPLWQ